VQNHVDQRTGQYNLAIDLQVPTGNDLTGPGLPSMSSTLEIIHKYHIISAQISAWEKPF